MPSLPRIRRSTRPRPGADVVARPAQIAELTGGGLTWLNAVAPDLDTAQALAERFGWHPLDVEDIVSKRQRPKIDDYEDEGYLFAVLHFPVYDKTIQRLNAAELDVFIGQDYLVTIPNRELLPVTRLFARCDDDAEYREQLFAKGSGRLLYEVLDDLFDYCFPILDKIGHKLDRIEDDMFEGAAEDVVRDISNAKQEIISYRKVIKPERSTLRVLERRVDRFLPEELEALLRRHQRRGRADLGPARQLQGGRRGARVDERVGHLAPPERRPAPAHDHQRHHAAADADHQRLRDERALPGRGDAHRVLGDPRGSRRHPRGDARLLPLEEVVVNAFEAHWPLLAGSTPAKARKSVIRNPPEPDVLGRVGFQPGRTVR